MKTSPTERNSTVPFVGFFIVFTFLTAGVNAQNFRNTAVGANIVSGITITENSRMNFGTLQVPTSPVQVILTTSKGRIATAPSGITLFPEDAAAVNASFTVGGSGKVAYNITLPSNGSVHLTNGADFIDIVDFSAHSATLGADGVAGQLNADGFDRFAVGATLNLDEIPSGGLYSGTFGISVNYN